MKSKKTAATKKSSKKSEPEKRRLRKKALTLKERKFVKGYVRMGNATLAAMEAGYQSKTRAGLRVMASEKLRKLALPIKQLMDRMGLDDVALIEKLRDGLNALFVKTASHEGLIVDQLAYVDFETRREYLDIAFRLRGSYAPEKIREEIDIGERLSKAIERRTAATSQS